MIWNVKKNKETESSILIEFSKNDTFDGIIEFDKKKEQFELVSAAKDCDEFETERLFQFLYALLQQNTLSFKPYSIRIG